MTIILLKLYSIFIHVKEMAHAHILQYILISYQSRPIIRSKNSGNSDNKALYYINSILFIIYLIARLLLLIFSYTFHAIKSLLSFKKGIFRGSLSLVIIVFLLFQASFASIYLYLSGKPDPIQLKYYQDLHRYRTATAIRDTSGNLIGAIPNPLPSPSRNISHDQRSGSLFIDNIPSVFWDILRAKEDKYLSFNYSDTNLIDVLIFKNKSYKGINIIDMLAKPYASILLRGETSSGNGLINQIITNIYGKKYFDDKCSIGILKNANAQFLKELNNKVISICQKTEELRAARHLFPYLAQYNGLEFKRWAAMHTPLLESNDNISGLRALSETTFNQRVESLSEAQQAILATSYIYKIKITPSISSWKQIINHAIDSVKVVYEKSQPSKALKITQDLKNITSPPLSKIPNRYLRAVASFATEEKQDYQNLFKRTLLFTNNFNQIIERQLEKIYLGISQNKVVTDMVITLPIIDNNNFNKNIDSTLKEMINKCKSCFNTSLENALKKVTKSTENNEIVIKILVSDEQGRIIRYYRKGDVFSKHPIAGIAKLPASILLASLGDTANTKYCNHEYKSLKNSSEPLKNGVKNCRTLNKQGHAFSFKNTIATSKNLPLLYALTNQHNISRNEILSLYQNFKLEIAIPTPSPLQLLYDLNIGTATTTLSNVHEFTHKITQTLFNSEFETNPHIIDQYLVANFSKHIEEPYPGTSASENKIQKYLKFSKTKAELRKILRSPVYHPEGTLRSFQNIPSVKFLFAQSGTTTTQTYSVKDKWSVGAFNVNGHIYSFLVFVGTNPTDNKGIGKRISHRTLIYPIMNEIIKSLR